MQLYRMVHQDVLPLEGFECANYVLCYKLNLDGIFLTKIDITDQLQH